MVMRLVKLTCVRKAYMHKMSKEINKASAERKLNAQAHIIYPEIRQTFWSVVIGLGYPTPEPPGFRWCTERLKINPSNAFTYNTIKKDGEIVILLGVRKAESAARSRSISSHEIDGMILTPHPQIAKAYVYSPLSEIRNENVWEYLLQGMEKARGIPIICICHINNIMSPVRTVNYERADRTAMGRVQRICYTATVTA